MAESIAIGKVSSYGNGLWEYASQIWQMLLSARNGTFPLTVSSTPAAGTSRTPAASVVTGNGSVTAGARSVGLLFSSDYTGTVLGATITVANTPSLTFSAPGNDTIGAIAYTVSAGSITILTVT